MYFDCIVLFIIWFKENHKIFRNWDKKEADNGQSFNDGEETATKEEPDGSPDGAENVQNVRRLELGDLGGQAGVVNLHPDGIFLGPVSRQVPHCPGRVEGLVREESEGDVGVNLFLQAGERTVWEPLWHLPHHWHYLLHPRPVTDRKWVLE